ncbi:GTPase-associated system all-helical protein GASH [Bradyrhizobium diazoefficiens]|uniref:GTPase-associated system all-helical protein GASH n=1 Tax=Bradyrhizobium diazoefficiens TaxID=1355477 RepID=UPI0027148BFE|nr:GTPase-associated system all-helical protein GASH [Bradyrhizobium diazoefficiens]WLC16658.1 GTPase-associated system all-helical protein GASH [Bradyrhizobium diazoefficiens]
MDPDFARWYREVSLEDGKAQARWTGLNKAIEAPNRALVEVLTRLAFDTKASAGGYKDPGLAEKLAAFHAAFEAADEDYEPEKRESQVLAACALVRLFGSYSLAQLAVTTASFDGARKPSLPMDLVGLAEQAIAKLSTARRVRPDVSRLKVAIQEFAWQPDLATLNPSDPQTFKPLFAGLVSGVNASFRAAAAGVNASVDKMSSYMRVVDEELQMLWWLLGERSLDLDLPFDKVEASVQPMVFAKELASRTVSSPGPVAIAALLARSGLKPRGKLSVVAAANAVPPDWAANTMDDLPSSPVTTPIHFALDKRVEAGVSDAWAAHWSALCGLAEDTALSPLRLSELFYREHLFLTYG